MPKAAPLILDFTQEDAISQLLPFAPLRSSHQLRWKGLYAQYHRQPAWRTPEFCSSQHIILVNQSDRSIPFEQVLDGCRQQGVLGTRDVVIVPAKIEYQASWDREMEFTLIFLEPSFVDRIASESNDFDGSEIVAQFAISKPEIATIGLLISSELQWQQAHSDLNLEALKRLLAVTLLRQYSISSKKILNKSDELPPNKLQRAIAYINDHLGEGLSLHKIAAVVEISPYYFARLFKEATGVALHRYLTNRRMEKAKQLLSEQNLSIVQVAKQVGIGSQSHFNRLFRNYTGTTPNAYRNERK